jgi:hypothetical protein
MAVELAIVIKAKNQASSALKDVAGDVAKVGKEAKSVTEQMKGLGESMQGLGAGLTAGVTAPIVAGFCLALKASTDFNAQMANVASLGIATDRVLEFKGVVQEMAVEMGKSTDDLAGGLYEVISSFGDTADTVEILRINAEAAAAGLATTQEAIALTSAVTKTYGDTSAEAVQHAADLAFMTVNLGQTTFPELAASIGNVTPMAKALGVTQEELFAQMATLTGVTGGAAEVSTQLRAVYQSLLQPTEDMAGAIGMLAQQLDEQGILADTAMVETWRRVGASLTEQQTKILATASAMNTLEQAGKSSSAEYKALNATFKDQKELAKDLSENYQAAAAALGQTVVQSIGLPATLDAIAASAEGNTNQLGDMFGSVEALNAVLALSGGQAETFKEKFAAMGGVVGASATAFEAQTQGINKLGFMFSQAKAQLEVFGQKMGDVLGEALLPFVAQIGPIGDKLIGLADAFINLAPPARNTILIMTGIAAALGPALVAFGTLLTVLSPLAPAFAAVASAAALLISPIGLVVAALAALIAFDVGGIRTKLVGLFDELAAVAPVAAETVSAAFLTVKTAISEAFADPGAVLAKLEAGIASIDFSAIRQQVVDAVLDIDWAGVTATTDKMAEGANAIRDNLLLNLTDSINSADLTTSFTGFVDSVTAAIAGIDWSGVGETVGSALSTAISGIGAIVDTAINLAMNPQALQAAFVGAFAAIMPAITAAVAGIVWIMDSKNFAGLMTAVWNAISTIDWSIISGAFGRLGTAIDKAVNDLVGGFLAGFNKKQDLAGLHKEDSARDEITKPSWVAELMNWQFPSPAELLDWVFPNPTDLFSWAFPKPEDLFRWAFPKPNDLFSWEWPDMSMPGWVSSLIAALSGAASSGGGGTSDADRYGVPQENRPTGGAIGTSNWRGGVATVGETGPETVWLPRGSRIFSNQESMAMAGAGAINVTVNAEVASGIDVEQLAYRVADLIRHKRGTR